MALSRDGMDVLGWAVKCAKEAGNAGAAEWEAGRRGGIRPKTEVARRGDKEAKPMGSVAALAGSSDPPVGEEKGIDMTTNQTEFPNTKQNQD